MEFTFVNYQKPYSSNSSWIYASKIFQPLRMNFIPFQNFRSFCVFIIISIHSIQYEFTWIDIMRMQHICTMIRRKNLLFTCSPSSMRLYWRRVSKQTRAKSSRMERNRSRFWFRSELNWTCEALQGNKNITFNWGCEELQEAISLPILYWSCEVLKGNQNITLLRIRFRDPVPFDPLDQGSGIGFFRIPDPQPIFLRA